jgi:hypothetical protein
MSQFIRAVLLEKAPKKILDKETIASYKEMLRLIATISNNINQIAKAYNALARTKVHFSQNTQQVIRDTLHIMQLWDRNRRRVVRPPSAGNDDDE